MQTAPPGTYASMMSCVTGVIKNEGPLAFYKVGPLSLWLERTLQSTLRTVRLTFGVCMLE
jgi:hypothetical protein